MADAPFDSPCRAQQSCPHASRCHRAGARLLDSNIVERALKRAILHRKNALFFRTKRGARVGDLFMSLISTCQLADANPFEYLTALHRNADLLAQDPVRWMPWNYNQRLAATSTSASV